jgi:hypothetical protein
MQIVFDGQSRATWKIKKERKDNIKMYGRETGVVSLCMRSNGAAVNLNRTETCLSRNIIPKI